MKTEELMIGDWVKYLGINHKVVSILTNTEDGDIIDLESPEFYGSHHIQDLKPIELTVGILEKNGFKCNKYHSDLNHKEWESKDGKIIITDLSNMNGRDWSVHIDNDTYQSIGSLDIQNVHELQNILRLCNVNKEIIP